MFTKPRSCCFCIDNKVATLILAVIQVISFAGQAYISYCQDQTDNSYNWSLFLSTFFCFIGIYGVFGVVMNNIKLVYIFASYFWIQFFLTLFSGITFSIFSFYSHAETCDLITTSYDEFVFCNDNFFSLYSFSMIFYGFIVLLRLHFCFAIWAFYRKLQVEQTSAELPAAPISKVVYPQYVYVGDVKTPVEA